MCYRISYIGRGNWFFRVLIVILVKVLKKTVGVILVVGRACLGIGR